MHIRKNTKLVEFLRAVNTCEGDVLFSTRDGDILNLKSELSRYVFAAISHNTDLLYSAEIILRNAQDQFLLEYYLEV